MANHTRIHKFVKLDRLMDITTAFAMQTTNTSSPKLLSPPFSSWLAGAVLYINCKCVTLILIAAAINKI